MRLSDADFNELVACVDGGTLLEGVEGRHVPRIFVNATLMIRLDDRRLARFRFTMSLPRGLGFLFPKNCWWGARSSLRWNVPAAIRYRCSAKCAIATRTRLATTAWVSRLSNRRGDLKRRIQAFPTRGFLRWFDVTLNSHHQRQIQHH